MADFNARAPGCDDDCGERGKRGKRGHRGRDGAIGPTGPAGSTVPTPAFNLQTTTIFARTTGSDATGDGTSVATAYRTFQRAIRDVPNIIPPGGRFVVDITDLGAETLPVNYEFPVIMSTSSLNAPGTVPLPFFSEAGLAVRATPQLALAPADAIISAADAPVITDDPDTGLVIVTIAAARPVAWAAGALKGKQFIRTIGDPSASCVIYDNTPTQLFLTNRLSNVGPLDPGEVFQIVEPSATLQAPASTVFDLDNVAIKAWNLYSVVFQGIKFRCTDPGNFALGLGNGPVPGFELCDVDGLSSMQVTSALEFFSSVLRQGMDANGIPLVAIHAYLTNIGSWFMDGIGQLFDTTVFDTCAPLENAVFIGVLPNPAWVFENCLFKDSTGDALHCTGGRFELTDVKIQGALGNAIHVERGPNYVVLNHVTGGTGAVGDPANAGFGVLINDGAMVQVLDDLTLVTGLSGDAKTGTLAPRTWADFRTNPPIKNEYDLTTPFVVSTAGTVQPSGEELTGAGTGGRSGSRLFQRP